MNKPTTPLFRLARVVERMLDAAAGSILAILVLIVAWGVFTRFALGAASWWTEESARLLLVWLTMLGAAAASARGENLGVDYFASRMHPDARRLIGLTVEMTVIAFAASVLVYGGLVLMVETLRSGQTTAAIGLRMGWVYAAVPISGLGMILFGVERIVRLLANVDPNDPEAVA
ncbi:2,3-diketo-L-gulonate TRAP transporter small permease protein YiaM [Botrimarina colliarenosi]|uniref:2,3-diketo-L-gulonate TRAP transporter small permease protein YiaM n=1 Tax=Botrimarina colliarenosi TaxID=2528001 RepID=A0A5C6AE15_9BACT|nr:TRAP transporter small permease [Botrimarina colliarenosi]TWT97647.1 2,3-diketo-L-gulonate TRAP transporter small permease protein YiaM [Botrimarina colliarenosi]